MKGADPFGAPLRVAHLVNSLEMGGMENGVVNICRKLQGKGFEFEVICLNCRGVFADRLPSGVPVTVLDKGAGFSLKTVWHLHRHLRTSAPDILHTHNLGPLIYGVLGRLPHSRPLILHGEHNAGVAVSKERSQLRYRKLLYPFIDALHTVGEAQIDLFRAAGFPRMTDFIPLTNGTDTERFAPGDSASAREQLGLPAVVPIIGMVARFDRFKRHTMVVDAFSRFAVKNKSTHLVFVGDGPERLEIERAIEASPFKDRIHLVGAIQDVVPFYQSFDLVLVPGVNEGLSNAVLEAMSCGVPCLVHKKPEGRVVVTHGLDGFVASLDSSEKMAEVLHVILSDGSLNSAGRQARITVESRFSLEAMMKRYKLAYLRLGETGRLVAGDLEPA